MKKRFRATPDFSVSHTLANSDFREHSLLGSQNQAHVEPPDGMAITAEPLDDEEEVPLAVLTADTLVAIEQLRADARAAAEASRAPPASALTPPIGATSAPLSRGSAARACRRRRKP